MCFTAFIHFYLPGKKKRKEKKKLLIHFFFQLRFFPDVEVFAAVIKRETEKEKRTEQNEAIKELNPLLINFHLPSMKLFFSNVETEEKNEEGEVVGELDQVSVYLSRGQMIQYLLYAY